MSLNLSKIRSGTDTTVIVINGFLSESDNDLTDWLSIVENTYKDATVLHLEWPASNIGKNIKCIANSKIATFALSAFIPGMALLSSAKSAVDLTAMTSEWRKSIVNTEEAGEFLAKYIDSNSGNYVVMGHSLGARVSYHTLRYLKRVERLNNVFLLGGAVSNQGDWNQFALNNYSLRIFNVYSKNDNVLKYLYRTGTAFRSTPIGRHKINSPFQKQIQNFDASHLVSGHMKYKKEELGTYIASILSSEI